ncbi:hypothetical protein JH06_4958 [Blastocystis sp. subtype 4]|uniref:hypothetical protein n=1 Tax=Blastocystis sp. subtype 4 TaxID=944170 RepID=UPI000711CA24|nr:hypothetical protein JH06_4958 [Blastocystis sp. subtype 4]KNB41601.1 hypothetical protein JH06_4958 [Blastocystis sp. subtype 4]|eukprot:XP_014525044.1 hypothetical protein JH06_4958 [Blastocystis sp. subtype 4]
MQPDQSKPTKEVFNLERAEEDDEFEEFERDDWKRSEISLSDSIHWEDNWDTTNENDDFCTQLRAEFDKSKTQ